MSAPRLVSRLLRPSTGGFNARHVTGLQRSFGTTGLRFKGPEDAYTGKLEHFTGGRQDQGPAKPELEVGEMEGITFKVEPLRRTNEDTSTMRARLLCMLTFATACLPPVHLSPLKSHHSLIV